jgi:hypothetical protein
VQLLLLRFDVLAHRPTGHTRLRTRQGGDETRLQRLLLVVVDFDKQDKKESLGREREREREREKSNGERELN